MPSVELVITLFGKPAWEIKNFEGEELGIEFVDQLRRIGDELRDRLYEIARVHELLIENGWVAIGTLYDIIYRKDIGLEEAKEELKKLGLEEYIEYLREFHEEETIEED